jgi:hypothetical protein
MPVPIYGIAPAIFWVGNAAPPTLRSSLHGTRQAHQDILHALPPPGGRRGVLPPAPEDPGPILEPDLSEILALFALHPQWATEKADVPVVGVEVRLYK